MVSSFNRGSNYGTDLVSGMYLNAQFYLFNDELTIPTSSSKEKDIKNYFTALCIDLSSKLTPLFLRSKAGILGGFLSQNTSQTDKKKVSLEGDFDKSFDLYTTEGFELEALQVFTPNFMEQIKNNWNKFNIEFIDNQIYIYTQREITKDEELESMYQLAKYLITEIVPLSQKMQKGVKAVAEYN
jgi:hypothetical protein